MIQSALSIDIPQDKAYRKLLMVKGTKGKQTIEQKLFAGLAKTDLFPIDYQPLSAAPPVQAGSTPEIAAMIKNNTPLTLANWLCIVYPDGAPDNWQQETDVPDELQDEFMEVY